MIIQLSSIYGFLKHVKGKSLTFILFSILLFSSLSAFLIGRTADYDGTMVWYSIYQIVILYLLFSSYKNYTDISSIDFAGIKEYRFNHIANILKLILIPTLLLELLVIAYVLPYLLTGAIIVNEFKNQGGIDSVDVLANALPHVIITIINLFSPLGYFALSCHFYYLELGRLKKSLLYLILSTTIPLSGLLSLSRSATVSYLLLYLCMLFLFRTKFNAILTKKIKFLALIIFSAIFLVLYFISSDKTAEGYHKRSLGTEYVNEMDYPTTYASLDYAGQWIELSYLPIKKYEDIKLGYGYYNSSGLYLFILKKIYGSDRINNEHHAKYVKAINDTEDFGFHGLVTMLVVDFGLLGTLLLVLVYRRIIFKLQPVNGKMRVKCLVVIPLMLPLCVTFFSGNAYSSIILDIAIIYNLIILKYIES